MGNNLQQTSSAAANLSENTPSNNAGTHKNSQNAERDGLEDRNGVWNNIMSQFSLASENPFNQ